jgi:ornithine carbamoyltransferase
MDHLLTIEETPAPLIRAMLERAIAFRSLPEPTLLSGKALCCLFEKPSLRTRVSFEQAMRKLGGSVMSMGQGEVGIGGRESPEDVARVLSSMVEAIMARVFDHSTLVRMAKVSAVPVINGLSDLAHPAQALADVLTMIDEFSPGSVVGLRGRTMAFVGDGNNVARSSLEICAKLGMRFVLCSPEDYALPAEWVESIRKASPGLQATMVRDPVEAVLHADAICCDTFVSMGQEIEKAARLEVFRKYQVNQELVSQAPPHAIVLHCLPAYRGIEITDEVIDGPRSRIFQQARNRLDAQMGLLATLLAPRPGTSSSAARA